MKKYILLFCLLLVFPFLLVGCGKEEEENKELVSSEVINREISNDGKVDNLKVFEPRQHVFFVRFETINDYYLGEKILGTVPIKDGYEILDIENVKEDV